MTFIDSLLNLLRLRHEIGKDKRQQTVVFIRKISDCCSSFSQSCCKLGSAENEEIFSAESINLELQVNLVEGYLEKLNAILKGRLKSETLDELVVILARIIIAEEPVANFWRDGNQYQAIKTRFKEVWKEYPVYSVTFFFRHDRFPHVYIHRSSILDNYHEVLRAGSNEEVPENYFELPTIDEFLAQLSALRAKLVVLADAIEAGATL